MGRPGILLRGRPPRAFLTPESNDSSLPVCWVGPAPQTPHRLQDCRRPEPPAPRGSPPCVQPGPVLQEKLGPVDLVHPCGSVPASPLSCGCSPPFCLRTHRVSSVCEDSHPTATSRYSPPISWGLRPTHHSDLPRQGS